MTDIIRDDLIQKLLALAEQEKRSPNEILEALLVAYEPTPPAQLTPDDLELRYQKARQKLLPKVYARARAYWQAVGDSERLALTDEELSEQFWLFDSEGIPRLKADQAHVELPENALTKLAAAARQMPYFYAPGDVSNRSREILQQEWGDHLLRYMQKPEDRDD